MFRLWVVAAAAMSCAACAPGRSLPDDAFEPIRIGLLISRSGGLSGDGPGWEDAARLAALEVNAAGGLLGGRPVELVVRDDETRTGDDQREFQASLARDLLAEGVIAVLGAAASDISLGVAEVLTPMQIPQVSCCSTSDLITEFNRDREPDARYLFRTIASDSGQSVIVALAAQELACSEVAILHLDDAYGRPFGEAIEAALDRLSIPVATRIPFRAGRPSYADEVRMIRAAAPACIALVAFPQSAGTILRDWSSTSGAEVSWIGTDGVRAPAFIQEVGDPALITRFYGTSPISDAATPEYNAYRDRFEASLGGEAPIPFSSNQYDAAALTMLAIERAGSTEGPEVRDALREVSADAATGFERPGALADALDELKRGRDIDYQGASGAVDFDVLGDVSSPYEIWRYEMPGTSASCPGARTELGEGMGSFCRTRIIEGTK